LILRLKSTFSKKVVQNKNSMFGKNLKKYLFNFFALEMTKTHL